MPSRLSITSPYSRNSAYAQPRGLTGDNPGKRERIITVGFFPAAAAANVVKVMSFAF